MVECEKQLFDKKQLHQENQQLKKTVNQQKHEISRLIDIANNLKIENEQLKQRNNNQYQQLNQLWQLIEAKDWKTLTEMDNQMKKDEERLQKEWKCYE